MTAEQIHRALDDLDRLEADLNRGQLHGRPVGGREARADARVTIREERRELEERLRQLEEAAA